MDWFKRIAVSAPGAIKTANALTDCQACGRLVDQDDVDHESGLCHQCHEEVQDAQSESFETETA